MMKPEHKRLIFACFVITPVVGFCLTMLTNELIAQQKRDSLRVLCDDRFSAINHVAAITYDRQFSALPEDIRDRLHSAAQQLRSICQTGDVEEASARRAEINQTITVVRRAMKIAELPL